MPNQPMILPQYQGNMYDIQRKQALAQALMQQGMAPAEIPAYPGAKLSPMAGVNKVIQALGGAYLGNQVGQDLTSLGQQQYGALLNMFGAGNQGQAANPQVDPNAPPDTENGFTPPNGGNGAPQASPTGGGSLRIPGLNPQAAAMAYLLNPDEYTKAALAQYSPTEATKMAMAAGQNPAEANAAALTKANYLQPLESRPGSIIRDPLTLQPRAFNPHVPEGGVPLFDASGNVVKLGLMPGATDVEGAMSGAKASGPARYQMNTLYDATGKPLPPVSTYDLVNGNPSASSSPQPNAAPAPKATGAFAGYTPPNAGSRGTLVQPPGAVKAAEGQVTQNLGYIDKMRSDANNASQNVMTYDEMRDLAKGFTPGGGADQYYKINNSLARFLPEGMRAKTGDISNYQTFSKFAIQVAAAQRSSLGGTADNTLQTLLHANPNPNMQGQTINNVLSYLKGGELAKMGKQAAFDQWSAMNPGNGPQNSQKFDQLWRQNYDPRIYTMLSMDPTQRASYAKTLSPAVVKTLQQKTRFLQSNGFIDPSWMTQ